MISGSNEEELKISALNALAKEINEWGLRKGFNNDPFPDILVPDQEQYLVRLLKSTKLMLVVTELAECVEGLRKRVDSSLPGFTNEEEEIADAIIRLLHYAGQFDLRIGEAVLAKMSINDGRPYLHNKTF